MASYNIIIQLTSSAALISVILISLPRVTLSPPLGDSSSSSSLLLLLLLLLVPVMRLVLAPMLLLLLRQLKMLALHELPRLVPKQWHPEVCPP